MINYHKSWEDFVKKSKHLNEMLNFICNEKDICPLKENVFRFMDVDLTKLSCVILGMDPYPSTYVNNGKTIPVATGRSFEVANVKRWTDKYKQTSLANIFKTLSYMKLGKKCTIEELRQNDEIRNWRYLDTHAWFDAMESQGVMFLNASLTTKVGKSGAHTEIWDEFINELIEYIPKVRWLIWGKDALERVDGLIPKGNIIYSCHPATRVNNTFIDDCCFKKINCITWL